MPENPQGWRRLWPSTLWLRTVEAPPAGSMIWNWQIWTADKQRKLAEGAETYSRQASAARGGVRFGKAEMKRLEELAGQSL